MLAHSHHTLGNNGVVICVVITLQLRALLHEGAQPGEMWLVTLITIKWPIMLPLSSCHNRTQCYKCVYLLTRHALSLKAAYKTHNQKKKKNLILSLQMQVSKI